MNYREHSKSTRERIVTREVRKLELRQRQLAERRMITDPLDAVAGGRVPPPGRTRP
jgi:hypothetical protein